MQILIVFLLFGILNSKKTILLNNQIYTLESQKNITIQKSIHIMTLNKLIEIPIMTISKYSSLTPKDQCILISIKLNARNVTKHSLSQTLKKILALNSSTNRELCIEKCGTLYNGEISIYRNQLKLLVRKLKQSFKNDIFYFIICKNIMLIYEEKTFKTKFILSVPINDKIACYIKEKFLII